MQSRILLGSTLGLFAAIASFPIGSHAATAAQKCSAAKLAAAAHEASTRLLCEARDLDSGADAACVARARARRDRVFQVVEARGGCATVADSTAIGGIVDDLDASLLAELRPGGPATSKCTAAQLGAAARAVRKIVQAYARNARNPNADRLAAALAGAQALFNRAYARAESKGDCLSATSRFEAYPLVTAGAARLRGTLEPACGDDVQAGSEECDGSDTASCTGPCAEDCTCVTGCGDNVVDPGEACDGAGCVAEDPTGCFPRGWSNECQCCAQASPCYVRGFVPTPVEVPCCTGVCEIPGPEAGPNVMTFCTEPPATPCPCWTSASIDATFPPGYFDQAGRGGVVCNAGGSVSSMGAADFCTLPQPGGPNFELSRAGAGVVPGNCTLFTELDANDDGWCDLPPTLQSLTPAQEAACVTALQASQGYQAECP
jgi:hypothetical protein